MSNSTIRYSFLLGMIALAVVSRILPHPHNFTPIGAVALFGAAYFTRKWVAMLAPFIALWLSDLFINNVIYGQYYDGFQWFGSLWVYGAFALINLLGMAALRRVSAARVGGSALAASVLFFIVTNFAVWASGGMYPKNTEGLIACFVAGLPFFGNTIMGDLFYSLVLFGAFEWAQARKLIPAAA
ncbi:MAG: hypothetical protein IAE84_15155 [Saprospiraceae bacterium]|nr:hypothetical protein [Saprospiraceae bacterium]HRD79820.1 hypothetical protein [Saprospiraceae bacterium]